MTEHDLSTLVRAHVRQDEPPFLLSADTAMALGRRTLLRRRARRGVVGLVAAAAVVAVALPMVTAGPGSDDRTGLDPATAAALEEYDAQRMPDLLEERVSAVLGDRLDGFGAGEFSAHDSQGAELPAKHYDKASGMELGFGGESAHRVRVALMHARSEAEGDARKNCAADLEAGYYLSCTVTTSSDGDPVTTKVMAVRPLEGLGGSWGALTREELRTGKPMKGNPSMEPIDPDTVYFERVVESVHSESFLTVAQEIVKAPDLETADDLWTIPVADLKRIVTDPVLVMPEPPIGDGGCPWTWKAKVTCSKTTP